MRSNTMKENHIGVVVCENLQYRQTGKHPFTLNMDSRPKLLKLNVNKISPLWTMTINSISFHIMITYASMVTQTILKDYY